MPQVRFTNHLRRFFPDLQEVEVAGVTVAEVLAGLEDRYPGLAAYIVDEHGALRQHVNIFVGNSLIRDREHLQDATAPGDRIFIFQALSGG